MRFCGLVVYVVVCGVGLIIYEVVCGLVVCDVGSIIDEVVWSCSVVMKDEYLGCVVQVVWSNSM